MTRPEVKKTGIFASAEDIKAARESRLARRKRSTSA